MIFNAFLSLLLVLLSGVFAFVPGQSPQSKPIPGEVVSVSAAVIVINTANGQVEANITPKTEFKRVLPENPVASAAVPSSIDEITTGDKVIVSGVPSADGKSVPARMIYLMSKASIDQKNAKESEEWKTRSISGKVTSIDVAAGTVKVDIRTLTGSTIMTLTPKQGAKFLRYAPDSIKFAEAKASTLNDIGQGDMLRALGDKGADGTTFAAETIISGAFQTVAGTVKSVDTAKNEVVIKDLNTNKDVTISTQGATVFKKFPEEMAQRFANMQAGGGARPAGQNGQAGQQGQGGQPQGAPGTRPGGFSGGRGGNVDEMLDRFPNITVADLKPGDMIAVSSSRSADPSRIKAIKLLAGVEPFLRLAAATSGGGRRGGQGVSGGFTIPGLDSFGF